jgi:8-oxo-dGTP diphosphatase
MITVAAALIENNGKLLVCQRRRTDPFPLLWEFPGGKLQPGETPEAALARELREELGVTAQIGRKIYRTRHKYEEMSGEIDLVFFAARADPAEMQNLAFERMEWREIPALAELNFLPADRELISLLAAGAISLS